MWPSTAPSAVPTRTGATAAGSVRGRAAASQIRTPRGTPGLRPPREAGEVRVPLVDVGVASLLGLLGHVEEEVGVVGQLLQAAVAVLGGVEAGLEQAQGERRQREHLAAPADRLLLQARHRDDRVDQAEAQGLLGVVLTAQEPDLLGLLGPDQRGEQAGAKAAVEAAHPGAHLTEAGVVGG